MAVYSANLRIPHLDQNVVQPEIPENTAKNIIDNLFSNVYVVNATADADIIITHADDPTAPTDWQSFMIEITDTNPFFTVGRNIILPDNARPYIFKNSSLVTLTFKTSAGTGVAIGAGQNAYCFSDGTNIEKLEFAPTGAGTTLETLTDTPVGYGTNGEILRTDGVSALAWYDLATDLATKLNHTGGTATTTTLSGTTTNSGTISGGTLSAATLSGTTTNSGTLSGGTISGATVIDYGETSAALGTSGTIDISMANGSVFTCTPSAAITFTFTTTHTNTSFTLLLTNASTNVTWPTVKWEGGVEPTWSVTGDDLVTFTKIGATWIGGALIGVA